jgi:hypothetical protein
VASEIKPASDKKSYQQLRSRADLDSLWEWHWALNLAPGPAHPGADGRAEMTPQPPTFLELAEGWGTSLPHDSHF